MTTFIKDTAKRRRQGVRSGKPSQRKGAAITIARIIDAVELGEVWVVRRASDRRGWRLVGARPARAQRRVLGLKTKTLVSAATIARFVGVDDDGTGRVSFLCSNRLPGVEGYVDCFGDEVALSLSGLPADTILAMLEVLISLKKAKP